MKTQNLLKKVLGITFKSLTFDGNFVEKLSVFKFLLNLTYLQTFNLAAQKILRFNILKYKIYCNGSKNLDYLFNEIFIRREYYFKTKNKYPIIIDCGANIGMSVLYFKYLYPESKIIAFEANPIVFETLTKNIQINQLKNVEINNIALADLQTELKFFIDDDGGTLRGSLNPTRGGNTELIVKADMLSKYLKEYDHIDLVKMDVEGAETKIILDLFNENILSKVNEYIIEYHLNIGYDDNLESLSTFLNRFEVNGFKYQIKAEYSDVNSFQDVLIHFYK
jgi:FkbM family methyltransferase